MSKVRGRPSDRRGREEKAEGHYASVQAVSRKSSSNDHQLVFVNISLSSRPSSALRRTRDEGREAVGLTECLTEGRQESEEKECIEGATRLPRSCRRLAAFGRSISCSRPCSAPSSRCRFARVSEDKRTLRSVSRITGLCWLKESSIICAFKEEKKRPLYGEVNSPGVAACAFSSCCRAKDDSSSGSQQRQSHHMVASLIFKQSFFHAKLYGESICMWVEGAAAV